MGRLADGSPPLVVAALGEQHARNAVTAMVGPGQRANREPERRALEAIKMVLELGADVNGADKWATPRCTSPRARGSRASSGSL